VPRRVTKGRSRPASLRRPRRGIGLVPLLLVLTCGPIAAQDPPAQPGASADQAAASQPAPSPAPSSADAAEQGTPPAAGDERPWKVLAKWTGSGDKTTDAVDVPAGEWQVVYLAVPRKTPSELRIGVAQDTGIALQNVTSGRLTSKRMEVTRVRTESASRIRLAISGADVFWGVWIQTR
jgi:hypothetical protein